MSFRTILGYTPQKVLRNFTKTFQIFGARHICGNLKAISFLLYLQQMILPYDLQSVCVSFETV